MEGRIKEHRASMPCGAVSSSSTYMLLGPQKQNRKQLGQKNTNKKTFMKAELVTSRPTLQGKLRGVFWVEGKPQALCVGVWQSRCDTKRQSFPAVGIIKEFWPDLRAHTEIVRSQTKSRLWR